MQPHELFLKKYNNYYVYLCSLQIIRKFNVIIAREHQDESLALWDIPFQTKTGKGFITDMWMTLQ